MLLEPEESQLVLVDYQQRLMPAIHDAGAVIANAGRLARMAALVGVPVFGTEQYPAGLGPTVPALRPLMGEVLSKLNFSACADGLGALLRPPRRSPDSGNVRSLPKHLRAQPAPLRNVIVIAGCEAHVCLLQTALELLDDEFDVWVVTDACSSRTERNRDAAFDRLAAAGAELVTTEMVGFEWLRSSQHPRFKELQAIVK